ncbi:MAG: hypothetical protein UW82_C0045G0008 [candidate division WWE3 bacterium GW2011_GWC2_44_9]|uniref:Uncharacterized protein n=1 Tax=candidate division WWE3 bacterium GW2011_GWC2_44_9 TaxID=1619125 RepID=A0A0G1KI54_UNCKA|nr:MAG: hypothetical protein UW82_C0045G0008 [candidate division WWE3 bacterium GW2011_GWC2_44_9]
MNSKFGEVTISNIHVLCVEATGVKNSGEAFNSLETKIGSLKGRKFYGTLLGNPETGLYRACVEILQSENAEKLGLSNWVIPGGRYLRCKITDWGDKTNLIGPTFGEMAKEAEVDETRPYIEFYRSQKELILMMPVR